MSALCSFNFRPKNNWNNPTIAKEISRKGNAGNIMVDAIKSDAKAMPPAIKAIAVFKNKTEYCSLFFLL